MNLKLLILLTAVLTQSIFSQPELDIKPNKVEFKDLFAYAAKREKKSYEFYTAMSNFIDDSELKKLFAWLAQEEKKHESDLVWDFMYR